MQIEVPKLEILDSLDLTQKRPAIIVVDMLNDFCHPDGSLFVPESIGTVRPIKDLLGRAANVPKLFVNDSHAFSDREFEGHGGIWPAHAVKNTWGAEVIEPLCNAAVDLGDDNIQKLRYDPFYGTTLDHQLRLANVDTVVIVGTVSNICVLATAHSAALRWYDVVVPCDCISSLEDFGKYVAYYQISRLYQGKLVEKAAGLKFQQ